MAPAVNYAELLGEDLLAEVLACVHGPDDLIRAAAAGKPFLRAARSGHFLDRFHRLHPATCPRLLGCLLFPTRAPIPCRVRVTNNTLPRLVPCFSSSSSSSAAAAATICRADFALSFLPGGWTTDHPAWQVLECRNGRVLLKHMSSRELAVANPMSRGCVSLPAPPTERAVGYGLVTSDGDSRDFRVVCVSRDAASSTLRALVLASGELSWSEVAGLPCQPNLAGSKPMQANQSLYWRLEGGEQMVAFSMVTMEFSLLQLPPFLQELSFDVLERENEEASNELHLLTMRDFCIEAWAGVRDAKGEMSWRRVQQSVRFHKAIMGRVNSSVERHKLDVVGVAGGVMFIRCWDRLFSIDLETMKFRVLSNTDCAAAVIYPYTIPWPPTFLNPAGQGV